MSVYEAQVGATMGWGKADIIDASSGTTVWKTLGHSLINVCENIGSVSFLHLPSV